MPSDVRWMSNAYVEKSTVEFYSLDKVQTRNNQG